MPVSVIGKKGQNGPFPDPITEGLKSCPFCGGMAAGQEYILEAEVFCTKCLASVKARHSKYKDKMMKIAIKMWNRRV